MGVFRVEILCFIHTLIEPFVVGKIDYFLLMILEILRVEYLGLFSPQLATSLSTTRRTMTGTVNEFIPK